jgi:hypothetical protein
MTDQPSDQTGIDEATEADREAVSGDTGRDGGPHDPDAEAAAEGLTASPSVADEYGDMLERGAEQQGEGRLP